MLKLKKIIKIIFIFISSSIFDYVFRIGLGLPKYSVYTKRFDEVISRVVEAGMVARWLDDLVDEV